MNNLIVREKPQRSQKFEEGIQYGGDLQGQERTQQTGTREV